MGSVCRLRAPKGSRFILASASPRRLDLLTQIGLTPDDVVPASLDESPRPGELPRDYVLRMAQEKAELVAKAHPDDFILAADTSVVCGRRILGKPTDIKEADRFLELLSGQRHRVLGGIALVSPDQSMRTRLSETRVGFKRLSREERAAFLASKDWQGKAGAYGIQGVAAAFVSFLNGSYSNVVGLDLALTYQLLVGAGFKLETGEDER